jgi:hypothetical protein
MKKYFLLLIGLQICFSPIFLISQNNTFERSFPSFGDLRVIGTKTIELPNNEYLVLSSSYYTKSVNRTSIQQWKNVILTKIDQNGYTIWRKEIETLPTEYRKSNQILLTNQNEILLITVQNANSLNALNLKKFDLSGNETFSSNLITDSSVVGCAITKIDDDNYLISHFDGSGNNPIKIIKIDSQLSMVWQKKIYANSPQFSSNDFFIKKWGSNDYAIGYKSKILKINSKGDSLFITGRKHDFVSETNDGSLLVSGNKAITKLDSMNNVIWTRNFLRDPGPAIQTSDGNYLVNVNSYPDSIIKIDESGNILWEKPLFGEAYQIIEYSDNSILISGILSTAYRIPDPMVYNSYYVEYFNCSWLLKTDPSGNYNSINLITPIGGENVLTFNDLIIGWHSNGVETINLHYSIDDGNSWNLIVDNFNADSGQYKWSVPLLFCDSIKIKIEDANNQNIFNYSEYPIYVSIYQPTDHISTNEIFMWLGNNGMSSHDPRTEGSGFYWPGGDSATIAAIYADGLLWGGKVNGEIRVNGATYRYGLQPGNILEDGTADNPFATQSKIFKIRKDWQTLPESVLKQRLEYDYKHWPIDAGAPWDDVNEDGVYMPGFDKPKFIGDETLFYVANDLDTTTSRYTYGSDPIGLEFQTTIFGFNREDLKDIVFKKYKVINKSNSDVTDMYFDYWADDDMGNANDDWVGCDTTLNLGFIYNSDNDDEGYYGTPPPAIGHLLVQSPIVPSAKDSARYNDGWRKGFHNLGMTSFLIINKSQTFSDLDLGVYAGTLQFYYNMQGLIWDGSTIFDPNTGQPTVYCVSGDPVSGTGWYEGPGWPGGYLFGDRRYQVNSGPFNLAVGDTQEVVCAIMMAKGTDNINSITKLRELAAHVQDFYDNELVDMLNTKQTIAPTGFTLYQNYPNPFNPKTTIEYEVPEKSFVTIKIYDILGREVQTLVNNEEKVRWKYKLTFDASTLASGVYFYRLQAGSFVETKKMVVLK